MSDAEEWLMSGEEIVVQVRTASDDEPAESSATERLLATAAAVDERRGNPIGRTFAVLRVIWYEFTGGVGPWGALRPLVAGLLAVVPFLFLGQHFNRQHAKARDWTLLQVPLLLTIVLWPALWLWSIGDAWWTANGHVVDASENLTG